MNSDTILYLILGITLFDFVFAKTLGILNNRSRKQPIPTALEGIYDKQKYQESQRYQTAVFNFSLLSSTVSFVVMLALLWFGVFGWLDAQVRAIAPVEYLASLYFFGILYFVSDLMSIPFDLYGTFVIEQKFGFNKTTPKTFVLDKLKSWLMTVLIGGLIVSIFIALVALFPQTFWLYFWLVAAILMVFLNMFYTSLIIPLFNKLTPLGEGSLRDAITDYSQKVGFSLNSIFVIDGSKRSSKANAFFSGLGKKKKVVLYDTLIDQHSEEELVAVLAHEVGHYKKKHIVWSMILSVAQIGFMLWLLSLMISSSEVSWALGANSTSMHINVLAFGMLFSPVSTVIGILMNLLSRKNEYEADEYAVRTYDRQPLISALKKLTATNLGNLTPHPAYVFVNYSHPSLQQRIEAMEKVA
ncbi:peptidase M48 [Reichenbachiella sp. 5M10]|uniref:M48 family metallopeptidase n=1 Tax=Reichenbachiella sp. 5M10 TaxID=1889772 RepID=UPI000C1465B4|nr:M48 family metallopeptidase [Reichenbachiella sp. 5M10]PIB34391.1 peptidase M48 [Reichenbachiella sp. 5M10]